MIDALEAHEKRRPAMKKTSTVGVRKKRKEKKHLTLTGLLMEGVVRV
jgi:hypothetical protein